MTEKMLKPMKRPNKPPVLAAKENNAVFGEKID